MAKQAEAGFIASLIYVILIFACILGWVLNIIKLFGIANDPITGMFIFRCIGIPFAPLGSILGYL